MRSQNITTIKAASGKVKPPPNTSQARSQPAFQPTPDNITVFADYIPLLYGGRFAKLAYLNGNNDNEAGYYGIPAYAPNVTLNASSWDEFNLEDFTCPTSTESDSRAAYGVPTWGFRYFGDWDNLRLYTNPSSSAYHGSDLEMVLGVSQDVTGLPQSGPEMQLQAEMMRDWTTFADDPVNGLSKRMGWPKYNSAEATPIRLGHNNSPIADFVLPSTYNSPCSSLNLTFCGQRMQPNRFGAVINSLLPTGSLVYQINHWVLI
jgi:cholinesterase